MAIVLGCSSLLLLPVFYFGDLPLSSYKAVSNVGMSSDRGAVELNRFTTPQMMPGCRTAGSGYDDATCINAAINMLAAGSNKGGTLYLPPPASGFYNLCTSGILIGGDNMHIKIIGSMAGSGSVGGTRIRILPGCSSPPSANIITAANYFGRLRLQDLTLDGWCLAAHNLNAERLVHGSVSNVVFRNTAQGGSNIYIAAGYENSIGHSNLIENMNDYGHSCYQSSAQLPAYGLHMLGSDSRFDGLVAVDTFVAGFYAPNGGGNTFSGAHSWGFISDPVSGVDLRSQWGFISAGDNFFTNWKVDNPTVGAIQLLPFGSGSNSGAIVIGGSLNNSGAANSPIGISLASGLRNAIVTMNNLTHASAANAIVQNGIADASTMVFSNPGASYAAGTPWPKNYSPPLTFSGNTLGFVWPRSAPISRLEPTGSVASITPTKAWYSTSYLPARWNGMLPSITLSSPPAGGTQATAVIVSMDYKMPGALVSGGSGYQAGDVLTLVGGTVVSGANAAQLRVTAVDHKGAAVAIAFAGTAPVRYSAWPIDSVSVSWTGGHGTGLTTHGMAWAPDADANISVTAPGSGYSSTPTVTYSNTGGIAPTSSAVLTNNLTLSAASGFLLLDSSGTKLGMSGAAGAPTISLGALVDGSGVRTALTTSGYRVPANTSLVRFIQTNTIASSIVTLPTAQLDGQPIQFVNYSGMVAAFTFSPTVNGWVNGSVLSSNTGIRVRWDAVLEAWQREQ